jgi:hypothetical protein
VRATTSTVMAATAWAYLASGLPLYPVSAHMILSVLKASNRRMSRIFASALSLTDAAVTTSASSQPSVSTATCWPRHIATDTLGLLLILLVTAASVQDTAGGRDVVGQLAARHPGVVKAWADSGYKRSVIDTGAAHGIDVEVVSKDPGQKGFAPLPGR